LIFSVKWAEFFFTLSTNYSNKLTLIMTTTMMMMMMMMTLLPLMVLTLVHLVEELFVFFFFVGHVRSDQWFKWQEIARNTCDIFQK